MRLFVGLALPEALRRELTALALPLPRTRWIDADDLHLTLRFIGEVDRAGAADIDDALARLSTAAFELTVAGVGSFGAGRRVRQLWAAIAPCAPLDALQKRVERACRDCGLAPEGRRFTPHVTLARCRGLDERGAAAFLATHGGFAAPPFPVTQVALFSSTPGRDGAHYRVEAAYPLDGAAALADDWAC